mmetsp:Transcript_30884/g.67766  ORF Transcript_30884/g.67766 Transcript_30884/m.67766 type:complete len:214 (-) Transcript_30884:857-1498(-)
MRANASRVVDSLRRRITCVGPTAFTFVSRLQTPGGASFTSRLLHHTLLRGHGCMCGILLLFPIHGRLVFITYVLVHVRCESHQRLASVRPCVNPLHWLLRSSSPGGLRPRQYYSTASLRRGIIRIGTQLRVPILRGWGCITFVWRSPCHSLIITKAVQEGRHVAAWLSSRLCLCSSSRKTHTLVNVNVIASLCPSCWLVLELAQAVHVGACIR